MLEKERAKMEEKRRREREDAIEEAKLAAERERMRQDFEREKEKARRKEVNIFIAARKCCSKVKRRYIGHVKRSLNTKNFLLQFVR